ncbi:hypothetical protein [Micromonospora echinospora]
MRVREQAEVHRVPVPRGAEITVRVVPTVEDRAELDLPELRGAG